MQSDLKMKSTKEITINTPQDKLGTFKPFQVTSYKKDGKDIYQYNICLMSEYSDRFPFLIRLEDYQKGNTMTSYCKNTKASSMQPNTSNMNNNQTNAWGGFGNGTNQNSNMGGFNNSNNNNSFGQSNGMNQNSSFGGFGQNNNSNNNGGGFGGFGQNKPATGGFGGFGQNNNSNNNSNNNGGGFGGFGQNKPATGGFGGFDQNNSNNNGGGFGGFGQNKPATGGFGGFGQNSNSNNNGNGFGGFGQNKPATGGFGGFGQNNSNNNGGGFGGFGQNNSNNNGGGFGGFGQNKPATGGFGGFGQNNNSNNNGSGFGSFGQNKPATGGFGGFGQNNNSNNNGGGFGSFGQNKPATGGFGGFGQNNSNNNGSGFGGFGGFGQNNNNNNNGGGFGGFGQNNTNNGGGQTTLTSTNGLLAGGFNVATNKVKENPYSHLQKVTSEISTTSSSLSCQKNLSNHSSLQPYSCQISLCDHSFVSNELLVVTSSSSSSTEPKQCISDVSSSGSFFSSTPFHIGVRYNEEVRVFTIQSTDTFSHFAEQVKNELGLSQPPLFSYCNHLLSQDSCISHCIADGTVVTALVSEEQPKSSTTHYTNNPPKLTKAHYTITPSIEELSKRMNFELAQVPNVVIEHPGIGKIEWQEPVNLLGLDLDEVIEIEKNENGSGYISVYDNIDSESPSYPEVGTGINHPAILTFYGVFPASGTIPEEFLKEKTKEIGGEFISYDKYSGNWSFKVPHFTRYGFDIEDEQEFQFTDETPIVKEIKKTEELKRVHFDSVSDLFYISKQRRVFQHTTIPPPPPQPSLQSCVPVHVTCPSSRSAILSVLQQTSFPVSRNQTQSSAASFPVLFRGNTLYSVKDYSSISESSFFTTSSAGELDDCLEILRSFTVYSEENPSAIPHIQICRNNLNSFLNQLLSYYSQSDLGSQYKHLLVLLLQVLFVSEHDGRNGYVWNENEFSFDNLTQEQQQLVFQKRRLFSRWLEEATKSQLWKDEIEMNSESAFSEAIQYLLVHDINTACEYLKEAGYERLALQISQINCSEEFQNIMFEQVGQWRKEGMLNTIDSSQYLLLLLLAGDSSILQYTSSWVFKLALYFWYVAKPNEPLESILNSFVFSVIGENDHILPWYESESEDGEEEGLFLLIEYFVHLSIGMKYEETLLFNPQNYCNDILDMSCPFLVSLVLSTQLLSQFDSSLFLSASFSLMEQLNAFHLWQWSVFIALFQSYKPLREKLVKSILSQYISECIPKGDSMTGVKEVQDTIQSVMESNQIAMITNDLGVSPRVVYESLSFYGHYTGNILLEVTCQLSAEDFDGAFMNLLREIIPIAITKNDLSLLQMSLNFFCNHEGEVRLWKEIGDVLEGYVDFLTLEISVDSFQDGVDLLCYVNKWNELNAIVTKNDLERMINEMSWRITAQLVECLKLENPLDLEHAHFVIQQLSNLSVSYDIKKVLYDSLREIVPM